MQIHTYRAKTIQAALARVRKELGPDASVLHTRELNTGLLRKLIAGTEVEVAASLTVPVPALSAQNDPLPDQASPKPFQQLPLPPKLQQTEPLPVPARPQPALDRITERLPQAPTALFDAFNQLADAGIDEQQRRELLSELRQHASQQDLTDQSRVSGLIEELAAKRMNPTRPTAT